ncbi:MAG: hypothetical protein WCC86_09350, partial [Methanoregula sp.]
MSILTKIRAWFTGKPEFNGARLHVGSFTMGSNETGRMVSYDFKVTEGGAKIERLADIFAWST